MIPEVETMGFLQTEHRLFHMVENVVMQLTY